MWCLTICNMLLLAVLALLLLILFQSCMYYIIYTKPGPKGDPGSCGAQGPQGPRGRTVNTTQESECGADFMKLGQRFAKKHDECGNEIKQTNFLTDRLFMVQDGKLVDRDLGDDSEQDE
jgi:hypothetical protein